MFSNGGSISQFCLSVSLVQIEVKLIDCQIANIINASIWTEKSCILKGNAVLFPCQNGQLLK